MKQLLITLTIILAFNMNAQTTFEPVAKVRTEIKTKLEITDSQTIECYLSMSGNYYIYKTSKKGKKYKKYLGYKTDFKYKKYNIYTDKRQTKYFYYTIENNKIKTHYLKRIKN